MPSYCYFKGEYIPLENAKIGVMTHALHYGTGLFEGIRGNWNAAHGQVYIFRLKEHMERMKNGCKVLRLDIPHTADELGRITVEVTKKSGFMEDTYIRPLAYKSSEALGVRLHNLESDFLVFAIPWGRYLDTDACRCSVSTWRRPDDNTFPPSVKATGLYINNALTKTEAIENGFDEGIMLAPDGHVAEGSGENLFLIENGKLVTPATYSSILNGITRDTVITLAKNELGLEVEERLVDRYELYTADECFLTGTAAHLTPVCEIDRRKLGNGGVGPITAKLKDLYFDAIKGNLPKYAHWCTPVF
ncbi:branched-chain amino acid transaminase [Dehalogenimonas sp. THU2]|uniref:branched-chain amino acid transaminase n=1 Tax=Dehalogenimonas sp. THU2 TaxID=3151121 RepID=UPI0032181154